MKGMDSGSKPFGLESCEHELEALKDQYANYYYINSPFNKIALNPNTYLIVGRRGSGKTSITNFFKFQKQYKNSICIEADQPVSYDDILSNLSPSSYYKEIYDIKKLEKIWTYIFWSLIFNALQDISVNIKNASFIRRKDSKSISSLIKTIFKAILRLLSKSDDVAENIEQILDNETFRLAKADCLNYSKDNPIFITIDSLERYNTEDDSLMNATSALISAASKFNMMYSKNNLFIKVFISAEIYPYIAEHTIDNTIKHLKDPLFLHWKPKNLVRLLCWRLFKYMEANKSKLYPEINNVDWDSFDSVFENVWVPYFGEYIHTRRDNYEKIYPYILRHTQMRPRQVIEICNKIAQYAKSETPSANPKEYITKAIFDKEMHLATEVINSYSKIHQNVGDILSALAESPMRFKGKYLHKISSRSSSSWNKPYSAFDFVRLVTELGIVGRVRSVDDRSRIISADFEYNIDDRLFLNERSDCVIHPMFYRKFSIDTSENWIVYPFPNHDDYKGLNSN